ncbi:hypothetical protein [Bacillus cereus]|nr:hypothetical protein [Bacillus cereus]
MENQQKRYLDRKGIERMEQLNIFDIEPIEYLLQAKVNGWWKFIGGYDSKQEAIDVGEGLAADDYIVEIEGSFIHAKIDGY